MAPRESVALPLPHLALTISAPSNGLEAFPWEANNLPEWTSIGLALNFHAKDHDWPRQADWFELHDMICKRQPASWTLTSKDFRCSKERSAQAFSCAFVFPTSAWYSLECQKFRLRHIRHYYYHWRNCKAWLKSGKTDLPACPPITGLRPPCTRTNIWGEFGTFQAKSLASTHVDRTYWSTSGLSRELS